MGRRERPVEDDERDGGRRQEDAPRAQQPPSEGEEAMRRADIANGEGDGG